MKELNKPPPEMTRQPIRVFNISHSQNQSLPMAITLNKYAIRCEEIAIASGKITPNSSSTTMLYDISRNWRSLVKATSSKSDNLPQWSEKEELASEVIMSAVTYLQRIGCKNIEKLLRDKLEQQARQCD